MTRIDTGDAPAGELLQEQRRQIEAQAVGDGPRQQEDGRGRALHRRIEALAQQLVGGHQPAAEILRQQQPGDEDAADDVAEGELQEHQVAAVAGCTPGRGRSGT